jgi:hypothetical protein
LSDRLLELRIKNQRLKEQVQDLESKVLSLVGLTHLESSGGPHKKDVLNQYLIELIFLTDTQLNIVSPKIDRFYATEIKNLVQKGIPVLIITNDRRSIPKGYQEIYDELKALQLVKIVNNPNVRYLLVFNSKEAIYSGGSLDKEELEKTVLIMTKVKESSQLRKIAEIFSLMLPSFMRKV